MKKSEYQKYIYTGLTVLAVVVLSILFFFLLYKFEYVLEVLQKLQSAFTPFVFGLIFAYLLTPIFNFCYAHFHPFFVRHSEHPKKISKFCSTLITMAIAFLIIAGLLYMVLPQLVTSIGGLIESNIVPDSFDRFLIWMQQLLANNPEIEETAMKLYTQVADSFTIWMKNDMLPQINSVMTGVLGTLTLAKNLLLAVFITVYVLNSKETFTAQSKKLIYSIFSIPHANLVIDNVRFVHHVFGGFINGKLLDSLIIGIISFVCMSLLHLPYAMLISVFIGVTNIIPFFGPFIGAIPSALLILMISPIQALYFLIFILVLQQFDGNILGPKILGDSTGLSSFWVLFSILIFGGIFGFAGMLIGVPLFAVLYSAVKGAVNRSLQRRNLKQDTMLFYDLHHVEPDTLEMCYEGEPPTEMKTTTKHDKKENTKNSEHLK